MMNVGDECDLPEDDGYDFFTRETEVERLSVGEQRLGTKRQNRGELPLPESFR
jgi:hypothetical protein